MRFDVTQSLTQNNQFTLYEVWRSQEALDIHGETPHCKAFLEFKKSGGILSFEFSKNQIISLED